MLSKSRRGIQSSRYIRKRRNRTILVCVLFVIAVGSVIIALSLLSKAAFLQFTTVQVNGTNLVSANALEQTVKNGLTGSWLGLFSKNSFFLYPRNTLTHTIIKDFPPVASVSLLHTGFHTLDVEVTERNPFAVACDHIAATSSAEYPIIEADTTSQCFYMDSTGFIYAPSPQFSPGVYVTYLSSTTITVGTYITDAQDFKIARQAVDYFTGLGIDVIGAENSGNNNFEMMILQPDSTSTVVASSSSPTIAVYFNMNQPLEKTFEYFSAFWQNETNKNFQYIDLRYGKDIVFKMK